MRGRIFVLGLLLAVFAPAVVLAAQTQVSLGNNSISPSTIDINAGDTVIWTNTSSVQQSVQADDGSFQSGFIVPGAQFATTFNQTGTYNYYDNAQGGAILGEVVVEGTSVSTPSNTPVPTYYVNPNENYVAASSNTNPESSSLTSEVQSLIAEIDAIEGDSSPGTSAPVATAGTTCPQIGSVLSPGSTGSDVSSLQTFLAESPTIYPEGLVTGYYGSLTETAVERWQTKYNIVSSGNPSTTGYGQVGPRTAAAMAIVCGGGSYNGVGPSTSSNPVGTAGTSVVGGFLQVTPISGAGPLAVTVNATVNTASSCSGAIYNLDFGDGSQDQQITVPSGNCSQGTEQFQHTYQYGGNYVITLSADGQSTTATVSVSGPTAPTTTTTTTSTSNPSQATGSMSSLVPTGTAPFTATFYVSCASGLAYDVVFGDGQDLGGSGVSQSSCNGGLQAVTHTYANAGTYNAQLVIFLQNSNGTVSPQAVATQGITVLGSSSSSSGSGSSTDTTPPTAPTSVSATAVSSSQVNLSWSPSTDNVGVVGYYIYRNGVKVAAISGTSYSDTGLSASTAYSYTVTAFDAAGNESAQSSSTSATTSAASSQAPSNQNQNQNQNQTPTVTYEPPSIQTDVSGNPLDVSLQYSYDTSGCELSIQWGDGTSLSPSGCTTLTGQQQTFTENHTYGASGSYTITLTRASQVSTIGVAIAN